MGRATSSRKNSARSVSCRCSAASADVTLSATRNLVDAPVRNALFARTDLGARSTGRVLPVRTQLRRGLHLPDHAGGDAGADDAGQAAEGLLLRQHQPAVLAARLAGGLCARPLGVPGVAAVAGLSAPARADRAGCGQPAYADESALAGPAAGADAGRVAAGGADEVRDLGLRHRRRAVDPVPAVHGGGARQARLAAGTADPPVRRARRAAAAQAHRAHRLGGDRDPRAARGLVDLAALSGT